MDTGVALAQGARLTAYRGLVNAVLRRLAREAPALAAAQEADGSAARRNTPGWLWDSWCAAYGEATAQAIATTHLAEPPLDLTLKDGTETAVWAARLDARVLPTGGLRLGPGRGEVAGLAGYGDGAWWVQDAAAALPARLLAPLLTPLPGQPVIDLCAAPGGKTAQLAAAGARVTAVDHSPQRLRRLAGNLERLRLPATLVEADARAWRPAHPAAAVLLDAPCSATGALRRHPDIAHLRGAESLASLVRLQDELLAAAVEMLAPDGRLVYATCSLQPEEGRGRIDALLAGGAPLVRDPVAPAEVGGLDGLVTGEGDLRSLPSQLPGFGGLDGFYACRLRRV